jgi:hypothetical protein
MTCRLSYSNMDKACNQYNSIKDYAPEWYLRSKKFKMCDVRFMDNGNGNCVVIGRVDSFLQQLDTQMDMFVEWWTANRPTQTCSQSGFCLPFPNEEIAFQDAPHGFVPVKNQKFTFSCGYPSAYYKRMGSKFIKPQIRFRFCDAQKNPMSKIYVLGLNNYQSLPLESVNQPIVPKDYQKPQWERLVNNALSRPKWV